MKTEALAADRHGSRSVLRGDHTISVTRHAGSESGYNYRTIAEALHFTV